MRYAIVRKSDGLIVNVIEYDPVASASWGALLDKTQYDLIPAPFGSGYELGNMYNYTTQKPIDLLSQLGALMAQLQQALSSGNQTLAQQLQQQINQLQAQINANIQAAMSEMQNIAINMQRKLTGGA